jgi:hypothetical protein
MRRKAPKTIEDMTAQLSMARPLAKYKRRSRITVNDKMQKNYTYTLAENPGKNMAFDPELSPQDMLYLGVFEGKYLNDCMGELPREWFETMLEEGTAAPDGPDARVNFMGVKSRQSLQEWRRKGWIVNPDVRGWFQWYYRYWLGRRVPEVDEHQIKRWRAFNRHVAQVKKSERDQNIRTKAQKFEHRKRQRQGLLQWAYSPV